MNRGPWKGDAVVHPITVRMVPETPISKGLLLFLGITVGAPALMALFIICHLVTITAFGFDITEIDAMRNVLSFLKTINGG